MYAGGHIPTGTYPNGHTIQRVKVLGQSCNINLTIHNKASIDLIKNHGNEGLKNEKK